MAVRRSGGVGQPRPGTGRLILASASPRRAELLRAQRYSFEIIPACHAEPDDLHTRLNPAQVAEALSYFKARSAAEMVAAPALVLAGDTVVACGAELFGKAADRADARRIISALAGTTHHVITGVTLLDLDLNRRRIGHDTTAVTMRTLAPVEVEAYLDTGAWEGKAGAYGIQDEADAFVTRLAGSFSNVVGFPMELIERWLTAWGIPPAPVPSPGLRGPAPPARPDHERKDS
ncbi:MAG TPA: Maf family protein [Phycisphaerae bacterium]|nr:Maf family protein [Phycisphaerae bacterium]HNU44038.1 Maf family protein [Phycisphaerae bacterium]